MPPPSDADAPYIRAMRRLRRWWPPHFAHAVLDAAAPLLIAGVGLISFQILIAHLGSSFAEQHPLSKPADLKAEDALLHTQLVFGAFLATNTVALIGMAMALAGIRRFSPLLARWANVYGGVLTVIISLALLATAATPLWSTMADTLFRATVITTLDSIGMTRGRFSDPLGLCITISNLCFAPSAAYILFYVAGLRRDFDAKMSTSPRPASAEATRLVLSQIYKLRTALLVAAAVMASGVANMIVWRFWPLAFFSKDLAADSPLKAIATAYRGLAQGSVIYQALIFTLIMIAIFFRPFIDLNDTINADTAIYDKIRRNGVISRSLATATHWLAYLAPVATATAATLLPGH